MSIIRYHKLPKSASGHANIYFFSSEFTHTSCEMIALITAHPSLGLLSLHPACCCHSMLTYSINSEWKLIICALSPHVLLRQFTAGECMIRQCVSGYPTITVQHMVTNCMQLWSPGELSFLRSTNEATRAWLQEIRLKTLETNIYIYIYICGHHWSYD